MTAMTNAQAISSPASDLTGMDRVEQAGRLALFGMAAALPFSIAVAQSLLTISFLCWVTIVVTRRETIDVPRFFWPLLAYGAVTLVSAAFSEQPLRSLLDCKQL